MNDTELRENFFNACVHYANANGTEVSDDTFASLMDKSGTISITNWNHDSQKPTLGQLKAFNVADVQASGKAFYNKEEFSNINEFFKYAFHKLNVEILQIKGESDPEKLKKEASDAKLKEIHNEFKAL